MKGTECENGFIAGRFAYLDRESHSLKMGEGYVPSPGENEVLIRVLTCGVCRTGTAEFGE